MLCSGRFFLLFVSVALSLVFVNCQSAQAQLVTYELGPFQVEGLGLTAAESQANAYGNLYDKLLEIEKNLPEGHVLLGFVIEDKDWIIVEEYYIEFHVIVGIPTPPGPPSGT